MPTITDIQPQVRRKGYYNIYVDTKYYCSLSELSLQTSGYTIKQILEDSELVKLKDYSETSKLRDKVLGFLAVRMRSRREVEQYLKRKLATDELKDETIAWLESLGYINDEAFAEVWVRDRIAIKPRSIRQLRMELYQKGIASSVVDKVLAEMDGGEQEMLKQVVAKKLRLPKYQDKQKLQYYLLQQGFSYDLVKTTIVQTSFDSAQNDTQ